MPSDPRFSPPFTNPFGSTDELIPAEEYALRWTRTDGRWQMFYHIHEYGRVYRYEGGELPRLVKQWELCHYRPPLELELEIARLAQRGLHLEEIRRAVLRPMAEVEAIMVFHGYRKDVNDRS